MRAIAALLLAVSISGAVSFARADAAAPRPFVATYAVSYRGISAGTITFTFADNPATGHYTYEARAHPSTLARLFVSRAALERSVMEIGPEGVRPIEWQLDDGSSGKKKDGVLHFDWSRGTVSGEIEGQAIQFPTEPGLQDRSSIQIAMTTSLLRGQEPGTIALIDDNRIKRYTYARKGNATLDSKLGQLDTIVYESAREGSSRISRLWIAPSLDYLPARAEQVRKGKVETVMELVSFERSGY